MQRIVCCRLSVWLCLTDVDSSHGLKGCEWQAGLHTSRQLRHSSLHSCMWVCLKTSWRLFMYCWPWMSCLHARRVVVRTVASIGVSGFFLTLHWQVVWQESYRKLLCGCRQPAPILKSLRLLRPGLHFLPQQHLNSASHFTQNEGYVSQTGSNWPLPWFPHWKEQLEKGGARRVGGCVTWPHREMPDVMWCVW